MSVQDCALMLRDSDPDRFAIAVSAPAHARARLMTLFATNLEIARAPLASAEPILAQMRLQWWVDEIGKIAREDPISPHQVLTPLAQEWGRDVAPLLDIAETRMRDALREPFERMEDLLGYIDLCSGTLMRMAVQAIGKPVSAPVIASQARAAGIAAWLQARPKLDELDLGIAPDADWGTKDLAQEGLRAMHEAEAGGRRGWPVALYPGAGARLILTRASAGQGIDLPEIRYRLSRMRLAFLGNWG